MRRYGIRSAILTILHFERVELQTKEVIQKHHDAPLFQLLKDIGVGHRRRLSFERISDDLELLYTSLQNSERQPKAERVFIFSSKKLTEEELTLLENRDEDFLNAFPSYRSHPSVFENHIKKIGKSSDPDSIFTWLSGNRKTIALDVTLKSMQEEMRKRVANEDLSDMEIKKHRVKWYNQNQFTYKFVKKESN